MAAFAGEIMTKDQWGRLLKALGQATVLEAHMNLGEREILELGNLAGDGFDWQGYSILNMNDRQRAHALDFASRLGIDPQTGERWPLMEDEELENTDDHTN